MNRRVQRFLAAAACAAAFLIATPPAAAKAEAPACVNASYLVQDGSLLRFDDRAAKPVARFGAPLDAVAYVPKSQAFWAVSGDRVVSFDVTGRVTRRAPLPDALRATDPIAVASGVTNAGAGIGDRWIVRTGREVVTYRVPGLKEIERHALNGPGADILLRPRIADWDVNPADGRLYTIVSGQLLRVDPHTGAATPLAAPKGLPQTDTFGALTIDPQGILHALHDPTGRLFDVDLAKPTAATPKGDGPPTRTRSDAAACPEGWDYGDAPAPYPTRRAADGPRHRLTDRLTLGTAADAEPDARATDKDDAHPRTARRGDRLTVEVTVRNATGHNALLAGWHDLDGNGRFDERDLATATVRPRATAQKVTLTWAKPRITGTRSTLRIRVYGGPQGYRAPAPKPTGPADSGEVEDHPITVPAPTPDKAPLDIKNLAGPAVPDAGLAVPVPGDPPSPLPAEHRRRHAVATTAPREPDGIPLTWSVFLGLLVPAASVAARAAAKRGSR